MFALSQLVDIPQIFRRLDALPRELATARQELWAVNIQVDEAQRVYDDRVAIALDRDKEEYAKCKNTEQRSQYKTLLVMNNGDLHKAYGHLLVMQEEQAARKANLADLNDEMSAMRKKIDLITALTMGRQGITAPAPSRQDAALASLARALETMRLDKERDAPGPVSMLSALLSMSEETAPEAEAPSSAYEAGAPVPFEAGDEVPF